MFVGRCLILVLLSASTVSSSNVIFDSKDSEYRQIYPQLFRIEKIGENTEISLSMQRHGPKAKVEHIDDSRDLTWYVDGIPVTSSSNSFYTRTNVHRWSSDRTSATYTLGSSLPTNQLRMKTFRLKVRFYQLNFVWFNETNDHLPRGCYSYFNHEIEMNGADLPFPEINISPFPMYVFEQLDYNIKSTNNVRSYEATFNFPSSSNFQINDIRATFEGTETTGSRHPYLFSSDHLNRDPIELRGDFIYVMDICTLPPCQKSKAEKVSITLTPESTADFRGMFKISAITTNIFNIRVTMNFDLTSYLYECLATSTRLNPFIPLSGLTITDFKFNSDGESSVLQCRVFGNEDISIDFFRVDGSGKRKEIKKIKYITFAKHETLGTLFLRPEDQQTGTYFCVATLSGQSSQSASVERSVPLQFD